MHTRISAAVPRAISNILDRDFTWLHVDAAAISAHYKPLLLCALGYRTTRMAVSGVKCAKCLQTLPKHGRLAALTISFPKTSDAQGKSTTKRAWFDFDPSFASPLEAAGLAEVRAPDRCICNRMGLNEKAHIPLNVRFGSKADVSHGYHG